MMDVERLRQAVAAKRKGLNLTFREVFAASGIPGSTFSNFEQGRNPDADTMFKFAAWVGMPLTEGVVEAKGDTVKAIAGAIEADDSLSAHDKRALSNFMREAYRIYSAMR